MGALEERVAYIEGRVEEHSRTVGEVRELILALDQKLDRRIDAVDRRFDAVDRRFDALDTRFGWILGVESAILVAVVAALIAPAVARYFH